jgi:CRP/FNR family transcriptional regulator
MTTMTVPACACGNNDCVLCEARLTSGLTPEQACQMQGLIGKHEYDTHEILFREREPSAYLYLVRKGQVKLTALGSDGREQIIGLAVAGQMLGFNSISHPTYEYTAVALTPVTVCTLRRADMLHILEQNPAVAMHVIKLLNHELTSAHNLIRTLGQKNSTEKVATFILSLLPVNGSGAVADLPLPMSRQEIAELLGLTVETVSRHMSDFRRQELIDTTRGRITIQNVPKLQLLAGLPAAKPALARSHHVN